MNIRFCGCFLDKRICLPLFLSTRFIFFTAPIVIAAGAITGLVISPNLSSNSNAWASKDATAYAQADDLKPDVSSVPPHHLMDFARLVTIPSDTGFAAKLSGLLDLDEFARFMAVTAWLSNLDGISSVGQSFYTYLAMDTDKFQFSINQDQRPPRRGFGPPHMDHER